MAAPPLARSARRPRTYARDVVTGVAAGPSPRARARAAALDRWRPRLGDLVLAAWVAAGALAVYSSHSSSGITGVTWWRVGLTLGVAALMGWRRRYPVAVTLAACLAVVLGAAELALQAVLGNLAARRRDRVLALAVACAAAALVLPWSWWRMPTDHDWVVSTLRVGITSALYIGLPVALGAYVGARRDLVRALQDRAERAEAEQHLRVDQARLSERTRIAQEMHDVLAHRISLIALHAGGLEVNHGARPEQVERAAALIRTTARQALQDLRGVLGVLRDDTPPDRADLLPQPTLADVPRLVHDSCEAGVVVRLHDELPDGAVTPELLGRTAYRVVQEGLTNLHKHAPGAVASVRLSGAPGGWLDVEVRNARPVGTRQPPLVPGAGKGLVGLRERVELTGGQLRAGRDDDDGFTVRARLPWPERERGAT